MTKNEVNKPSSSEEYKPINQLQSAEKFCKGETINEISEKNREYENNFELKNIMLDHFRSLQKAQNRLLIEIESIKSTLERNDITINGNSKSQTLSKSTDKG